MAIQTISTGYNPISGVFGTGQVQMFFTSGSWTVPTGISRVRARVWGGGGYSSGGGGGFSLRAIYDLTGVTSIAVTIGAGGVASVNGGTSSFGSYASATGGTNGAGAGGSGSGGDINYSGGTGSTSGAGAASIFGRGGGALPIGTSGGAGQGATTVNLPAGAGFMGSGGLAGASFTISPTPPTSGLQQFSIDFIGTGGGGGSQQSGINGSGGGAGGTNPNGGIPGGGAGASAGPGGQGLVIVEW